MFMPRPGCPGACRTGKIGRSSRGGPGRPPRSYAARISDGRPGVARNVRRPRTLDARFDEALALQAVADAHGKIRTGRMLKLQFGQSFADLYATEGLARVDAAFCALLAAADPALGARLAAAR